MKTVKYSFMITAAALAVACNDIIEPADTLSMPVKEVVLTATREGLELGTKSFRLDDGSVWWSPKEEVSVFYGSGTNGGSKFSTMNTSIAETVELQGSVQMSGSGKDFWAVYPYSEDNSCDGTSVTTIIPSDQEGVEGNFSNDVFPAVAKSSTMNLAFWNICGGIKFFVSRDDVKYVTFKGNNDEPLAGKVKVTFGPDGTPVVQEVLEPSTEVTLTAPEGGTFMVGKNYYITLLPTGLQGGFTMSFRTENEKGTLVSTTPQIIKRSTFGVLKNIDSKVQEWKSNVVEPEYVDLGLSVKWATFNVGATRPEEYGDYFAYGETEPYYSSQDPLTWKDGKSSGYDWPSYKWCNGSSTSLTKYNTNSSYGTVDNKTVLDPEDDAAHVNWGGSWRMPTIDEWIELGTKCTWTGTTQNGVNGRLVTGPNGKSIFLPAAGIRSDADLNNAGPYGNFWSSSLNTDDPYFAYGVNFYSDYVFRKNYYRYYGFSVRPVYGEFIPVELISLDRTSLKMNPGVRLRLTATVIPSNATARDVHWASSDLTVATVDDYGSVTALSAGVATITAYGSNGVNTECRVTVIKVGLPADLGLPSGLKWATMNVGASKPEEYGDYFAWGETEPYYSSQDPLTWKDGKSSGYDWPSYKWCNGSSTSLTKYNTNSSYGTVDNKTVLDPEDDAAHVNWGGSWRMPTDAEWTELRTECTWTWTTEDGVSGRKVTGPNGNSIFLPAAGNRSGTYLSNAGSLGYFWSSSLAYDVSFYSSSVLRNSSFRYAGFSVRPVIQPVSNSITIDGDFSDWAALPAKTFSQTYGDEDASHPALTYCKVYANSEFIYVYVEWDTDYITDKSWVIFHCFINTDGNAATGGYADQFADACSDILLEGAVYADDAICSYWAGGYAWIGEPNGPGWSWAPDTDNLFPEDAPTVGAGIDGKYEFSISRSMLAAAGFPVADVFSIGFDIQQKWNSVGVLPNASACESNPSGTAPSLKVITQK